MYGNAGRDDLWRKLSEVGERAAPPHPLRDSSRPLVFF